MRNANSRELEIGYFQFNSYLFSKEKAKHDEDWLAIFPVKQTSLHKLE